MEHHPSKARRILIALVYRTLTLIYLSGANLDLDVHNEQEGVFFVNPKGKETRVSSYGRAGSRQVIFGVPALAAGDYTVVVGALRGQRLESGTLATTITVEAGGSNGSSD